MKEKRMKQAGGARGDVKGKREKMSTDAQGEDMPDTIETQRKKKMEKSKKKSRNK
jgi:hypothetical protein